MLVCYHYLTNNKERKEKKEGTFNALVSVVYRNVKGKGKWAHFVFTSLGGLEPTKGGEVCGIYAHLYWCNISLL